MACVSMQGSDAALYSQYDRQELNSARRGYSATSSRSIDSSPVQEAGHSTSLGGERARHR